MSLDQHFANEDYFDAHGHALDIHENEDDKSTAKCVPSNLELLRFEYHVLYHISYGVPYLSFNAYKSGSFE